MDIAKRSGIAAAHAWHSERTSRLRAKSQRAIAVAQRLQVECLSRTHRLHDIQRRPTFRSQVVAIDDKPLGTLDSVNPCCIEVVGEQGRFTIRWDGLFVVSDRHVETICNGSELHRYVCLLHQPEQATDGSRLDV